ncbi:hypothetical protein UFOVP208_52 [uncultured Caudovirales phage]|uniref:Uncharacterized protein n=1 Tax=uncultured Caudovirales phage TaxID=2100421 RepID=A0A6J7WK02_9CAUD|nr:hypothetical protein UFOVP208_52 [uncultured Caudovirales phage]
MEKQTAVEFLVEQLDIITRDTNKYDDFKWIFEHEIEQAKEMEKQQIIDANSNGWHDGQEVIMNMLKSIDFVEKGGDDNGEQYYNETYGSKDITLQNQSESKVITELSDEEIEKAAEDWQEFRQGAGKQSFEQGAKWYREQLKQRQ